MHLVAVLNRDGGTLRTRDLEAFSAHLTQQFEANGHRVDCHIVAGPEVDAALRKAAEMPGVEGLVAGGGDGTISTAATIAFRTGLPLAILPAGTMNMFARSLKIPLDLDEAVSALAAGEVTEIDIAAANGQPFVHQFGIGVHARLVRIRETMTYRSRVGKLYASLRSIVSTVVRPPLFAVEIHTGRGIEKRQVAGVSVSNNPFGEGHIPYADNLERGVLGVYVALPMDTWMLIRLFIDVMRGQWKSSPQVWEKEVRELTLRFPERKRSAQAVLDGELIDLPREVNLRVHPKALKVIVPRAKSTLEDSLQPYATNGSSRHLGSNVEQER